MRIIIKPTARKHSVTDHEMRSVIEHYEVRHPINASFDPQLNTYMYVGRIGNEPWLEVGTEETDQIEVFHAMLLTQAVADDVYANTGGSVDLRGCLTGQRPHIGPQAQPVHWPVQGETR